MAVTQKNFSHVNHNEEGHARPLMSYLETIADRRSVPGVLSFSATGDVLYMNTEAEMLCRQILGSRSGEKAANPYPSEVLDMCEDLKNALQEQLKLEDYEHLEFRRVTGNLEVPVLLRGFLLPDPHRQQDTRFLILMEKIGRESRVIPVQATERFHLTEREQEIVRHIADGRTNKDIANALSISEHTVKEHVRHLLKKTKSSTRTGILAQIYQDS
ncbi:LuxR C-terminal-related transcriptional regulator [Candidatus Nitrospira salsa]